MSFFDGVGVQPPAETAAQRYARDVSQRRGDWQGSEEGNLVYDADGRIDREFLQRGGDVYYTYDSNGEPVAHYDTNGRNERIYVNYATGDSAVQNAGKSERYDDLKANR